MSVALRGNLLDFGIADIFQLIGQQRKTGVLEFSRKAERVQILFDRGAVVSAAPVARHSHDALADMLVRCGLMTRERVQALQEESQASAESFPSLAVARGSVSEEQLASIEDLLTRETIFAILRWSRGSFDFRAQAIEHQRPMDAMLGAEQILMDGLRMVDEWQDFEAVIPSGDLVLKRVGSDEALRSGALGESPEQRAAAERVLALVDGRLAVQRIIDLSRLGTFDATRALANLRRHGVVEALDTGELRSLRRRARPAAPHGIGWRRSLAVALPLALLLAVAASVHELASTPAPALPYTIEREPLEALRAAHAARRVKRALEAYRFREGHWPTELAELERAGLLPDDPDAAPLDRYHYALRAEGPVLLAPAR